MSCINRGVPLWEHATARRHLGKTTRQAYLKILGCSIGKFSHGIGEIDDNAWEKKQCDGFTRLEGTKKRPKLP